MNYQMSPFATAACCHQNSKANITKDLKENSLKQRQYNLWQRGHDGHGTHSFQFYSMLVFFNCCWPEEGRFDGISFSCAVCFFGKSCRDVENWIDARRRTFSRSERDCYVFHTAKLHFSLLEKTLLTKRMTAFADEQQEPTLSNASNRWWQSNESNLNCTFNCIHSRIWFNAMQSLFKLHFCIHTTERNQKNRTNSLHLNPPSKNQQPLDASNCKAVTMQNARQIRDIEWVLNAPFDVVHTVKPNKRLQTCSNVHIYYIAMDGDASSFLHAKDKLINFRYFCRRIR